MVWKTQKRARSEYRVPFGDPAPTFLTLFAPKVPVLRGRADSTFSLGKRRKIRLAKELTLNI